MKILILNAGSSSLKSCLYELGHSLPDSPPPSLWNATVDWTHHQGFAAVKVETAEGAVLKEAIQSTSCADVTTYLLNTLRQGETQVVQDLSDISVVGHRVVHGGQEYQNSVVVTPEVKAAIDRFSNFAPIHNPANLAGIEAIDQQLGTVPQVAVFDTAFHAQIPLSAAIYPGPYEWFEQGIRRYGFHGISHHYCAQRTAQLLRRNLKDLRLIICHLGNGCSLSAIRDGCSIDTTMGFTPLDGLMMGTRSGSVDPSILIHLLRQRGYSADDLDQILNQESGLKGISGISADMRQITAAIEQGNFRAQLALDVFIHRLRSCIGAMLMSLGRLDAIVFTAGIGENSPPIRAAACEALEFLGLKLDHSKNEHHPVDADISTPNSTVRILVIHTQEDWAIAQQCWHLVQDIVTTASTATTSL